MNSRKSLVVVVPDIPLDMELRELEFARIRQREPLALGLFDEDGFANVEGVEEPEVEQTEYRVMIFILVFPKHCSAFRSDIDVTSQ